MKLIRLDKFLSDNTPLTRSQIRTEIKKGNVKIGDTVIKKFDEKIDLALNKIYLNNQPVGNTENLYLMMNKPSGILTASSDKSRQTVMDFVPQQYRHFNLFAVGRLDKDTTGLLLITTDGDFAHKVISPKYNIEKTYIADIDGIACDNAIDILANGVTLCDGTVCRPAKLEFITKTQVRVTVTEGKYHLVKRILGMIGLGVVRLHRERIGKLKLPPNTDYGQVFVLNDADITRIFS